jgi:hypothetical protein
MNIFAYAASEEKMFENIMRENGYERKTTFYSDLSIAEVYGKSAIVDTYNRVVDSWGNNRVYFTEFVMCLNYKSWEFDAKGNTELTELYVDLYYKADEIARNTFKGEDLEYYYNTTD